MKRGLFVVMCALILSVSPSLAGIGKGSGEIGFDFGATSFDSEVSSKAGGRLVFRGGYHFSKWFELEGESSVSAHAPYENTLSHRADIVLQTLFVNGVLSLHSKSGAVLPYLLLGVGRASLDFPRANVKDSGAAKQIGVGCRFFFGDASRVAFRLQAGQLMEDSFDQTSTHTSYVAGFTWRLGGGA